MKQIQKANTVPIWEKVTLSIDEAAAYSGIGLNRLRELTNVPGCPYVIYAGKRKLIKRKQFEKYIEQNIEM